MIPNETAATESRKKRAGFPGKQQSRASEQNNALESIEKKTKEKKTSLHSLPLPLPCTPASTDLSIQLV
jgi:hypothetical protein